MLKKVMLGLTFTVVTLAVIVPMTVQPAQAVMPMDCEEFLNGGGQGSGLDCIDMVIFMYESAGPWDGTWSPGGYGEWPPY